MCGDWLAGTVLVEGTAGFGAFRLRQRQGWPGSGEDEVLAELEERLAGWLVAPLTPRCRLLAGGEQWFVSFCCPAVLCLLGGKRLLGQGQAVAPRVCPRGGPAGRLRDGHAQAGRGHCSRPPRGSRPKLWGGTLSLSVRPCPPHAAGEPRRLGLPWGFGGSRSASGSSSWNLCAGCAHHCQTIVLQ